ncbi:MAG: hypothetical protein HY974_01130 [Candidatus Kerfeldbacteria bacterium]|nr:hypothetical protein [Candidatus Kerfeldbacteria bacterium]
MKKIIVVLCLLLGFQAVLAGDRDCRHTPTKGDKLQIGLGVLVVPGQGGFSNPQLSFAGLSKEGFGILLSLGTQLLPGNLEFVSLKHYSLELALQVELWQQNSLLIGWRHASSYPSALRGVKPNELRWGMYYGVRFIPVRRLLGSDNISLQLSYWPTTTRTRVAGAVDNWEYNSRHMATIAISYNLEL